MGAAARLSTFPRILLLLAFTGAVSPALSTSAASVLVELRYEPRREETVIFAGRIGNVFSSNFELTGL